MTITATASPEGPRRSDPQAVVGIKAEITASLARLDADRPRLLALAESIPLVEVTGREPAGDNDGEEMRPLRLVHSTGAARVIRPAMRDTPGDGAA